MRIGDWRSDVCSSDLLVLENIFSTEEVAALQAETARLLASPAELAEDTVITEPGGKEIRSIFQIHAQSNLLRRLAADERLAGVASFLLADTVSFYQSTLTHKPIGTSSCTDRERLTG